MTRYCANLDGKHAGGLNVCASCARKFREALGSIAVDTPALLLIAARQAGTGDNDRTGVRAAADTRTGVGTLLPSGGTDTARGTPVRLPAGNAQDGQRA